MQDKGENKVDKEQYRNSGSEDKTHGMGSGRRISLSRAPKSWLCDMKMPVITEIINTVKETIA